jgi:hypothetical protein
MGGYQTAGIFNNSLIAVQDGAHGGTILNPGSTAITTDVNSTNFTSAGTTRLGNFVMSRTGSSSYSVDLNEANLISPSVSSLAQPTTKIFISASSVAGGGPSSFNGNRIIAAWFGGGLTGTASTGLRGSIAHRLNAAATAFGQNLY